MADSLPSSGEAFLSSRKDGALQYAVETLQIIYTWSHVTVNEYRIAISDGVIVY